MMLTKNKNDQMNIYDNSASDHVKHRFISKSMGLDREKNEEPGLLVQVHIRLYKTNKMFNRVT